MPGTEEVLVNGGLYHDSCLDGTLREAVLREQRKGLYRGEWGRVPPWGQAGRVLAPLRPAEPYVHFILYHSLGTGKEGAIPEPSTLGTFPCPLSAGRLPSRGS